MLSAEDDLHGIGKDVVIVDGGLEVFFEFIEGVEFAGYLGDWPVEVPMTAQWLLKVFAKAGLSPTQWLDRFFATARWSDSDRSAHEMRCLAK